MKFEEAYKQFIAGHSLQRKGERLRRIEQGLGHAEMAFLRNVWWPAFHNFEHLHPEYEVCDYKDGYRYLDFAYILPFFRISIEVDGLGPHWKNITKWQLADQWERQNHLLIDGWNVLRFTYDEVNERPRVCQQVIQQFMGRWHTGSVAVNELNAFEREILRLVILSPKPVTPTDVCDLLDVGPNYSQRKLRELAQRHWLQPSSGTVRVRSYVLHPSRTNIKLQSLRK